MTTHFVSFIIGLSAFRYFVTHSIMYQSLSLSLGIIARFFLDFQKALPRSPKSYPYKTFAWGNLLIIWCQGVTQLCGVRRSPRWLISRPSNWLSCPKHLYRLSLSPRFAEGLDVADLSQDGKFASFSWQKTFHVDTRSIGCPAATRGSSYWPMVLAQPLHFAHFNYRNPCHKIHFSLLSCIG